MDSKAIRLIVTFGVIGTLLLTVMMMFTLDQATDTQMPKIAADIAADFQPSLADEPQAVRLTMRRELGPPPSRLYTLHLRPNAAIAASPRSLATLMYDASNLCAVELDGVRGEVRIRCVAELPGGESKELTWLRDANADMGLGLLREIAATAPAQTGTQRR